MDEKKKEVEKAEEAVSKMLEDINNQTELIGPISNCAKIAATFYHTLIKEKVPYGAAISITGEWIKGMWGGQRK